MHRKKNQITQKDRKLKLKHLLSPLPWRTMLESNGLSFLKLYQLLKIMNQLSSLWIWVMIFKNFFCLPVALNCLSFCSPVGEAYVFSLTLRSFKFLVITFVKMKSQLPVSVRASSSRTVQHSSHSGMVN